MAPGMIYVAVVTALATTSNYMATPLVPLAAHQIGAGTALVGLVTGIFGLLPLLLAVPLGRLSDRSGAGRLAAAGAGLMALCTVALLVPTVPELVLAQALRGLGQVGLMIGMQGFVAALIPSGRRREVAYGTFVLAVSVGQLAGPAIGGWVSQRAGLTVAFTTAAALAAAAGLIGLGPAWMDGRLRRVPAASAAAGGEPPAKLADAFKLLADQQVRGAVTASCCVMLTTAIATSFYPLYLAQRGIPIATIGLLLALRGAAACLGRPLLPIFIRSGGRWRSLRWCLWAAGLATVATPLSVALLPLAVESMFVGLAMGISQPITMAVMADSVGEARRGEALSLRIGANRLLQFSGPLGLGLIGEHAGLAATFVAGGLLPVAALFGLRQPRGAGARGGD